MQNVAMCDQYFQKNDSLQKEAARLLVCEHVLFLLVDASCVMSQISFVEWFANITKDTIQCLAREEGS